MVANIDTMFYYGETPWHGLGTELDHPATAEEAIVAAGMDWTVRVENLQTVESGLFLPKARAVIRNDNDVILGDNTVGRKWTPLQNREAFGFFDGVVGEGQAIYHTAGSLGNGERVWILAKLPGEIVLAKGDVTEKFLLLANSHDGSMLLSMLYTPIRVVCQNTLSAAIKGFNSKDDLGIKIKHFPSINAKIAEAQRALGLANQYFNKFEEQAQILVQKSVSEEEIGLVLKTVFPGEGTRGDNTRGVVRDLFESEKNRVNGVTGTAWGLYNAITEYTDYARKVPKMDQDPTRRLSSIWMGTGAQMKVNAWDAVNALVAV